MSNNISTLYKFDEFCLDTNQKCLLFGEKHVSLTPKAYQTLLVLIQNRRQIVDKEFLLNEVWADTFVEETTLSQNILTLRKTLRIFQKDKDFIVTYPRRGFKFVADVQEIANEEEIIVVEKHTTTHIITEQQIHDSTDTNTETAIQIKQKLKAQDFFNRQSLSYACVAIFCLAIGCLSTWYFLQTIGLADSKTPKFRLNTLVSDADITNATVSPNGKYVAVIRSKDENQSLSLRQIENGNTIEIVPKLNGNFMGAIFSPDSEQIFYSIDENKSDKGTLYKIPIFGGASHKVLDNISGLVAISPEKKQLAFIRQNLQNQESVLIISDIDGKNERNLAIRQISENFTNSGVSWSPDGRLISATVKLKMNDKESYQIAIIDAETGQQNVLTKQNWSWAGQTIWLKNGIIVPAYRQTSPTLNQELWQVNYPNGNAKYLTNGIKGNFGISYNADKSSVVAVKTDKLTCFLSASLDNFRKSNHISTRVGDACLLPIGADWTNDGKIVYSTMEGGNGDIWTTNEDGSGKRQLTSDESAEISPQISKDGKFLIFLSNRTGKMNIWRANPDGTNPIQLTDNENVKETIISPDGNTIFYLTQDLENLTETLWKISINGENKIRLTTKKTQTPRISPDGKIIASYYLNAENQMALTLLSAETGKVLRQLETPIHDDIPFLDWSKDGENLYVIMRDGKPFSLWKIGLNNEKPEKMREWENDAIFRFVISKDGERVFYEVGTEINSVVQFEGLPVE